MSRSTKHGRRRSTHSRGRQYAGSRSYLAPADAAAGLDPRHSERAIDIRELFGRGIASATRWADPYPHRVSR